MIEVLFAGGAARWEEYKEVLPAAIAAKGIKARVTLDCAPDQVDYVVYAPVKEQLDFTAFSRTKAVLSLWAGIEKILTNETLTQPLCRMVDPGLTEGMVEWVTGHALRHHLGMDAHIVNPDGLWQPVAPPLARDRVVTVLGLGELGRACASALARLNFSVRGWSRTARDLPDIATFSGVEGLGAALEGAQMVILLLPDTPQTHNTLNSETLARLAPGAVVLNPGRGTLIDDAALLAALDAGQIAHATLDTFRIEPLPQDHPYWSHKQVTITPHIASETRPASASGVIAENILRAETGQPLLHLVDSARGY